MSSEEIKKAVRDGYGKIASEESSCCGPMNICSGETSVAEGISKDIGYSSDDMNGVPDGANLGLGCGNPVALASLKPGETVVDLGSGAGFDCFLAAKEVGDEGKVIGIDMTEEMFAKAKENAKKGGYKNVEFRLGELEHLPVESLSVDVVISNCVINLVPDKAKVFSEALRVLKPGGRLMVSDIVLTKELPQKVQDSMSAYVGCLSGAVLKKDYLSTIQKVGFSNIDIKSETSYPLETMANDSSVTKVVSDLHITEEEVKELADGITSINLFAMKLAGGCCS